MKDTYTAEDLKARYATFTALVQAECTLETELVGGQPATDEGLRMFVKHHLKLENQAAEEAFGRIKQAEIGTRELPEEAGELEEYEVGSYNCIRRDAFGSWLGDWMPKACLKAAASRLGLFQKARGSKGDLAEMGLVRALGISLLNPLQPERIYLIDSKLGCPVGTFWQRFMGRVHTPQGSKSIVTWSECAPPGTRFSFELRYYPARLTQDNMADVFAAAMVLGLGSCKSFERGKFRVDKLSFDK